MLNSDEAMQRALAHHQAGRLGEAVALYGQVLAVEPRHAQALQLLGAAYLVAGDYNSAVGAYDQLLAVQPSLSKAHFNRGSALHALADLDRAAAAYREALRLDPRSAEAMVNLGDLLKSQNKLDDALAWCDQAVQLQPQMANAWLGRGNALQALGQTTAAIADFRTAIRLKPDYAEAHNNLGTALEADKQFDEALAHYRRALELHPTAADVLVNVGSILQRQSAIDEASELHRRALVLDPRQHRAHFALGSIAQGENRLAEALAHYEEAIRLCPDYADAHRSRATVWLAQGDFERGWRELEWRFRCPDFPRLRVPGPWWNGSPLAGRRLLIQAEQGLGDTLQFIRYVPLAAKLGGAVIVEVQPALKPLLAAAGIAGLCVPGGPREFDVQAPLMSLPHLLGATIKTVPADVPYLSADPRLVAAWRERLAKYRGFKVGIVWQGSSYFALDHTRSIPLRHYAPLAAVAGVELISLQKYAGTEQLAALDGSFSVVDLSATLDEEHGAFMDTAAVMKNLDLVITSDTAAAHLAGGLGVNVWVALSAAPEWRWMTSGTLSPWYPTMRLFRQSRAGDWPGVFAEMQTELENLVKASRPAPST